ncbi:MAG: aldehyde dehydrogenase family protein [Myxococcales bacterium]|nr:aldehyde dehydrogenase family protein [Myxococcales bacterium]MDP3500931.1 aldehyde dehydrogenase family protein [Myxococcales bacterium]
MATAVSFLPNTARIREVFERQRATALRLRTSTAEQRIAKLRKLRDAVIANTEVWYRAGHDDFQKPKGEIDLAEILPVVMEANDAIKHLASWMKPTSVMPTLLTAGTSSQVKYEPRGRCLIISPWNYPLNLTFGPLVSAIAAGNTAIIKPSEMTPNLSAAMTKLVGELFTEDEVAIFEGEAAVSQALLELPFDHIFFTGSPAIGKVVMAAAAKHLTSVTLELGGKSPTIIDATADLDLAAKNIMWGKFTNAGQTCIAPDHIFVHRSVKDAFVAKTKVVLENAYGKDGSPPSEHLAHVVNARHTTRIKALLDDAKAKGARVLFGGQVDEKVNSIAPTLLDSISPDSKIMQEEIFGPLLPIFEFDSLDEVITKINAEPKPLALYIYSSDDAAVEKVLGQTSSGGACVNHAVVQFGHGNLPFGGVNNSGIGNAHGLYGFRAFSHERAVVRTQLKLSPMLLGPGQLPERIRSVLKSFMKWL